MKIDELVQIKDFPCYWVSKEGFVFSEHSQKILKGSISKKKQYLEISLRGDGKANRRYVHRLVAEYFCEKPEGSALEVDHIDGNKVNNHYTNLQWVTRKGNLMRAVSLGLIKVGEQSVKAKLSNQDVEEIRQFNVNAKASLMKIGEKYGINYEHVRQIIKGVKRKHG